MIACNGRCYSQGAFEDTFGRVWGYLGQAWRVLGRPWSLEIASWLRLWSVLKGFAGVLRPSGCILEGLEGVWRAPKQAQTSFEEGLRRFLRRFLLFFRRLKPKTRISENVDFP